MTSKTRTEEYLRKVQLPEQTNSYTVISHGDIIDKVRDALSKKGFVVETDLYKAESAGEVALGFMQLKNDADPDMGMTFNWSNSYNKQLRFSCGIGGFIYDNKVPFVSSNEHAAWTRKHTGTALDETLEVIDQMVESAQEHFEEVIKMKRLFQSITISRKEYAKLIGILFFDKKILSIEQASMILKEYDKPSFDYKETGTLWALYKLIMFAVKDQAPKKWYQQQIKISNYITLMYEQALDGREEEKKEEGISISPMSEEQIEMVEREYAYPLEESKPLTFTDLLTEKPVEEIEEDNKQYPATPEESFTNESEEEVCDNCGSTNVTKNSSDQYTCNNCGDEEETTLEEEVPEEFYADEEDDDDELIDTFLNEDTSELLEMEDDDEIIEQSTAVEQDVIEFKNEYYGESTIESVNPIKGFRIVTLNTNEVFVL